MKRAVIVQARMTSTRLPGKVLMDLAGHSVLKHVLQRCSAIRGADIVCCAVPMGNQHDPVAKEAAAAGAEVVRGSESDVLDRYREAARLLDVDIVMRVTSDCPLIDPGLCSDVLAALEDGRAADYAANNFTHRFPHGLDCEAFTRAALERAWNEATEPSDREHVTPWLRRHPSIRRLSIDGPEDNLNKLRWTVDYPEDMDFCRALFAQMPEGIPTWRETLAMVRNAPHLSAINAERRQR